MEQHKTKITRINLHSKTGKQLEKMMNEIKTTSQFTKVNTSKLVAWIIDYFASHSFKKSKQKIIADHFQSKEYFKQILQNLDDTMNPENTLKALQVSLKNMHSKSIVTNSNQE